MTQQIDYFHPDGTPAPKPAVTTPELVDPLDDGYTSNPTIVRVWREVMESQPWHLDGVDERGRYTEAVETYSTREKALAELPRFVLEYFPVKPTVPDTIDTSSLLRKAYGLVGDGQGGEWDGNHEYTRALVELVSDVLGIDADHREQTVALIRQAGAS